MAVVEAVDWQFLLRALFALGIGMLIGVERERDRREGARHFAGMRTLSLMSLSGALLVRVAEATGPWVVAVGAAFAGGLGLLAAWWHRDEPGAGATTSVAVLVTYLLGVLVGQGALVSATALGLLTTFLLLERGPLHHFAKTLTIAELRGAILFLVVALVLLPSAPREPLDPWDAVSPRTFLIIVVIVSSVSFLGFLAMRRLGPARGMVASGMLAGLVDSDAAVAAVAAMAGDAPSMRRIALRAGLLTAATGFLRNVVIAAVADPSLRFVLRVGPVLVLLALVQLFWAWWKTRGVGDIVGLEPPRVKSPFAMKSALRFAVLFALVTVASAALQDIPGTGSWAVYLAAFGGLVSSAAVVASMGALVAGGTVPMEVAVATALLSAMASAWVKPVLVGSVNRTLGRSLVVPSAVAGALALLGAIVLSVV